MKIIETDLPDLRVIEPRVFGDARGFFLETFNARVFREHGLPTNFVQDNHSRSGRGVLRGLHFQDPGAQGKLVRVTRGKVWDVAVDIRRGSPTFGRHFGLELDETNQRMLWIPEGFAHGFCVLSDTADFQYKCTALYSPKDEKGFVWNDPDLGIPWPVKDPLVSEKDLKLPRFADYSSTKP
jgi:dTDP-4-dehydrorhamnose 3,5-epimerase